MEFLNQTGDEDRTLVVMRGNNLPPIFVRRSSLPPYFDQMPMQEQVAINRRNRRPIIVRRAQIFYNSDPSTPTRDRNRQASSSPPPIESNNAIVTPDFSIRVRRRLFDDEAA
jgi:hypothetical protein